MIFKIKKLPKGLTLKKGTTLALGEATGHHHTLIAEDVETEVKVFLDKSLKAYFEIKGGNARLTHQEHKTKEHIYTPGIYVVEIEEGYDYTTETLQKVID